MSVSAENIRDNLIIPALESINMNGTNAITLLLRTCAVESDLMTHWVQLNKGPAKNPFGVEPGTFSFIFDEYLMRKDKVALRHKILESSKMVKSPDYYDLTYNIRLCIQTARLIYWIVPEPIPAYLEGQAAYWKKHYNSIKGKGTVENFIEKSEKYGL